MLRHLRAPPKTDRSAAPGRRLQDLARALEETEHRIVFSIETPEQTRRRREDPILGIPVRAATHMRRVARHWDARVAAGLGAPSIGRLRKEMGGAVLRDDEKKVRAIGRWLRANGLLECLLPTAPLTAETVSNLACAHTTCSCAACREGDPSGQTCEVVAVCRAAVDLHAVLVTAPASPLGQHLRAVVGTINALSDVVKQVLLSAPELEGRVAQLQQTPNEVVGMLKEPDVEPSVGLEFSVLMLRAIVKALRIFLEDRCQFNSVSLHDVGAAGPGAPEHKRVAEQHLAAGGLAFVRRGRSLTVAPLRRASRKRPQMADRRTRFIRAKAIS
jgi:hypothetical protein